MLVINYKKYKPILDSCFSLLAAGISLVVLQIFVFPNVARILGAEDYGRMQSTLSLVYMIAGTFGSAFSTSKLLKKKEYADSEYSIDDDYLIIATIFLSIILVLTPISLNLLRLDKGIINCILITVFALMNFIEVYAETEFRILIDYNSILICRLMGGVFYLVGYGLFLITTMWPLIIIIPLIVQTAYCRLKVRKQKCRFEKTLLYRQSSKNVSNYTLFYFLDKSIAYIDKLFLFPLLGGVNVTIYYVACILGKVILQIVEPVANVILSYICHQDSLSLKRFRQIVFINVLFCSIAYLISITFGKIVLNLIYPQWMEEAFKYMPIALLGLCASTFAGIINPFAMRYVNSRYLLITNFVSLIVYLLGAVLLTQNNSLWGACMALVVCNIVRSVILCGLLTKQLAIVDR